MGTMMTIDHVTTANGDSSEWINGGLEMRMRLEPWYFFTFFFLWILVYFRHLLLYLLEQVHLHSFITFKLPLPFIFLVVYFKFRITLGTSSMIKVSLCHFKQ
jgi:hypothetical protein